MNKVESEGGAKVLDKDDSMNEVTNQDNNIEMGPKRGIIVSSTLQRDIDESEGRIVLRRTDERGLSCSLNNINTSGSSNKLMLSGLSVKKSLNENDDQSFSTTTSDVNSDDDAASIVSRLSRIVVEQEGILTHSSSSSQIQQQKTLSRSVSSNLINTRSNNNLKPNMSKRQSLVAERNTFNNNLENSTANSTSSKMCGHQTHSQKSNQTNDNDDDDDSDEIDNHHIDIDGQSAARSSTCLPEIHVINDNIKHSGQDVDQRNNKRSKRRKTNKQRGCERRTRAKSVVEAILGDKQQQQQQPVSMRRNESSGFLPEKGDLRDLENSRINLSNQIKNDALKSMKQTKENEIVSNLKQPIISNNATNITQARLRSNTAGSVDRSTLFGGKSNAANNNSMVSNNNGSNFNSDESMLNIRRSAWTLSEFDQTYDGSSSTANLYCPTSQPSSNNSLPELNNVQQQQHTNMSGKSGSEKLLIKASKNAISMNQSAQRATSICSSTTASKPLATPNFNRYNLAAEATTESNVDTLNVVDYTRRPSQAHSISSLASVNSFNKIFRLGFGKISKYQQGEESFDNKNEPSTHENHPQSSSCCNFLTRLNHYFPIIEWLSNYNLSYFCGDLTAGTAVAVLNISTSLSSALVAGTDFGVAFRASIVNTFIYSILCSSKHTSFGSWSIMSQMLLVSVTRALSDELILSRLNMGPTTSWEPKEYERWHLNIIIMYTFLIGLIQLICGLLNLGNILASFIPEALCSSLITATAFTMAVGQLANMGGTSNRVLFSIEKNTTELWADLKNPPIDITDIFSGSFRWIKQIALIFKYNEQINIVCVIISIVSVILLFLNQYVFQTQLKRLFKRNILLPSEMILLVVMIIVSNLLNLKETYQVTTCGPIYIDFVVPDVPNLKLIRELWFESVATALISYTMVYVMAKTYSNKFNYDVDFNQELIACGAGNLIGGLFDSLPATASFSRTAGQVEAGGQTQMASIINCIVLVILAQIFGKYVAELPVCVMAATLFYGFVRMMSRFSEVFKYWRVCKVDFAIWMVTFLAILTSDIVNGFVYGFIFSILTMLYRAQK